jgi:ATP-binding cassette, subfamily A (ABC1), member 3
MHWWQINAVVYKSLLIKLNSPISFFIELSFPMLLFFGFAKIQTPETKIILGDLFNMLLFMSLSVSLSRLVFLVVSERESRMQEMMKILGLSNLALYVSWFFFYAILMFIVCGGIVPVIIWGDLVDTSPIVLFVFYFTFCCASISFSLFISVPFESSKVAQSATFLIYFLVSQAQSWVERSVGESKSVPPSIQFWLALVFPQAGFSYGNKLLNAGGSIGHVLTAMMLSTVIYFVLFWYFDQVVPRKIGFQKNWLFPLSMCFTRSSEYARLLGESNADDTLVELNGISKQYDGGLLALDNVSLEISLGSVTVLLGPNGAGKTTMINILTGMIEASSGTVSVFGQPHGGSVGYCPQHDILWPELSVTQHFFIFGKFKLLTNEQIRQQSDHLISVLGLVGREHVPVSTLSGGMKRRVSVGIAFLGSAKFIVLDEPSSGLDPLSRTQLWDALGKLKSGRAVLMSTHYLDEAELVGDRIEILNRGQLKAGGTANDLKREFNCGYKLQVLGGNVSAEFEKYATEDGEFFVPLTEARVMTELVESLGDDAVCAISTNRLEEVFMRICDDRSDDESHSDYEGIESPRTLVPVTYPSVRSQSIAVMKYRFLLFFRTLRASLFNHVLPLIVVIVGLSSGAGTEKTTRKIMFAMLIAVGFTSVPGHILAQRAKDQESKHLMIAHGLSQMGYWTGNFLADIVEYFIFTYGVAMMVVVVLGGGDIGLGALGGLLFAYGPASIAHTYLLSLLVPNPTLAQILNLVMNMLIGSILPIVGFFADMLGTTGWVSVMFAVFRTIPSFRLGEGLIGIAFGQTGKLNAIVSGLVVLAAVYFGLTVVIDWLVSTHKLQRVTSLLTPTPIPPSFAEEDETVIAEREMMGEEESHALELDSVSKRYTSPWAVAEVPLCVPSFGEVFGLLGQNSAGKSTLLKMATGDILPTIGDVRINGTISTKTNVSAARSVQGYCPQFDLVGKSLFVVDLLNFFARIRGVHASEVDRITGILQLTPYLRSQARTLSGGYLRRVSLAISLIGSPGIAFLDEPTCGMDAVARRSVWKIIKSSSSTSGSIVVTTHSMEEAEAISTRVGIMSKGRMVCIGTILQLREKFRNGLEVFLLTREPVVGIEVTGDPIEVCRNHSEERLNRYLQFSPSDFPLWWANETLLDQVRSRVHSLFQSIDSYAANTRSVRFVTLSDKIDSKFLKRVFSALNQLVNEGLIVDYSVTQNSLEQVFNAISAQDAVE